MLTEYPPTYNSSKHTLPCASFNNSLGFFSQPFLLSSLAMLLLPLSRLTYTIQTTPLDLATQPLPFGLCNFVADSHSFFQII